MTPGDTPSQHPAPAPEGTQQEWSAADEAWFAKLLATFPPLGPRQREALARLLDLGGGHDEG
jgi:hypothetical protein